LRNAEIGGVIETGTKHMVSLIPKAVDNYEQLPSSKLEEIKQLVACLKETEGKPATDITPDETCTTESSSGNKFPRKTLLYRKKFI